MSRKYKQGQNKKQKQKSEENTNKDLSEYMWELNSLNDYISQYNSGSGLSDVSLKTLYSILKNPYKNIKKIRTTSRYFNVKYGIVRDVNKAFKNLPTLNYHLVWSNFEDPKKIKKYEKKIYDLLDTLRVQKTIRDGLGEEAELGTVVVVNRNNKYIQFLELDDLRINRQINGSWIVEYDLQTITTRSKQDNIDVIIESLPPEITKQKYDAYKIGKLDRYVEIKNAYVLNIDGSRNYPYGFPLTIAGWGSLIHKSLIDSVEKSVADRAIKNILVMYAKSIIAEKDGYKPPNKDQLQRYFADLKSLMIKKDQGNNSSSDDMAGTGILLLPSFIELKEVESSTNLFPKELYEKIQNNIYSDIGVSGALISGSGSNTNFSSAAMNSEKFFQYIYSALDDWEFVINDIIQSVLPSDLKCKFFFDKTTTLNKKDDVAAKKEFYMQTSIWIPWAEAVLGVPYHYALGMAEYQSKVLEIEKIIKPAPNANTQSGNSSGRPEDTNPSDGNMKSKNNNANDIPSASGD